MDDTIELPLTFVMLSHIDDDHANGLLELTQELIDAMATHQRPLTRVLGLWHNSFDDIINNGATDLATVLKNQFGLVSLDGDIPDDAGIDVDACKVLASSRKAVGSATTRRV